LIEDPVPRTARRPLARASNASSSPKKPATGETRSREPTAPVIAHVRVDDEPYAGFEAYALRRVLLRTYGPSWRAEDFASLGRRESPSLPWLEHPFVVESFDFLCVWSTRRSLTRPAVARLSTRAGPMALALRRTTPERFAPPSLPRRKTRLGRIEVLWVAPTMACALSRRDTSHAAPLARATCERPRFSLESSEVRPARSPALSSAW